MIPRRRMVLFVIILTLLIPFFSCNANAKVLKLTRFSSRNFDLKVLTVDSWEATFGKNPDIPRTDEEVLALARQLYPPLGAKPVLEEGGKRRCGEIEVGLLFAALQNPAIKEETREAVDLIILEATPPLPKEYTSGRFRILYTTTDPDARNNTTLHDVKALAADLNANWDIYAAKFTEPLHYHNGDGEDVIDIWLYYLPDASGQTSSSWVHIEISADLVKYPCNRKLTAAHELFHRVQFAYGYDSASGNDWLVEGSATWAEKYRYPREMQYMDEMNNGLATPTKDLLVRSYDAAHLFVYLTERNSWLIIRDTWANYQAQGAEKAFKNAVEARTGLTFMNLLRNWHTANYVKDLTRAPAKYDYAEDEAHQIDCTNNDYGPLRSTVVSTRQYVDPSCITRSVGRYGADYVVFKRPANPNDLTIKIEGGAGFNYRIIPIQGKRYRGVYDGDANPFTFTQAGWGKWTKVAVLVVGGASGGSYTITVGDKECLKHGLKLMVGRMLINNQPYQDDYLTTWAMAGIRTGCDNKFAEENVSNPCSLGQGCDFPLFQYDGCRVTGGGLLTIDPGASINYSASASETSAAFGSITATNNAKGTELAFSLVGSSLANPGPAVPCIGDTLIWQGWAQSNVFLNHAVLDIKNAKDHPVYLRINWEYTMQRSCTLLGDCMGSHWHRGAYRLYPCPSDPKPPDLSLINLFNIREFDPSCNESTPSEPLSGSHTLSIDPGHVQYSLFLESLSGSDTDGGCSEPCTPDYCSVSTSYSGTVTLRLEDP